MSYREARLVDPATDRPLIPTLAQLHHDCITLDHTMAGFLPPLDMTEIEAYWKVWMSEVESGTREIIVITCASESGQIELAGVVSLWMPTGHTGPFRSEVHKLLVSPGHRFKGIARKLMAKLEAEAKQRDRWLVMLDTTMGSGAEFVYPKLGYKTIGIVPNYGFSPQDGKLRDEMFFYKDLRDPGTVTEVSVS